MIKIKNTEIQHLLGGYDFEVTIAMLPPCPMPVCIQESFTL